MLCPQCRMANPDSAQYCSKCGKSLGASATPSSGPASAPSAEVPTSRKAIASMVCGIFTFFLPASIAAIILGHISLSEIRKSAGSLGGSGYALTGLILGYAGIAVIPLVLLIVAIAIPNLLRTRTADGADHAVGSLRTIRAAAVTYAAEYENGFPSSLAAMGVEPGANPNCNHASLLDDSLVSGRKFGYVFTYTPKFPVGATEPVISPKAAAKGCTSGGASGFTVTADPVRRNSTGRSSFYTDQTGVIRYSNDGEPATADSPPLE